MNVLVLLLIIAAAFTGVASILTLSSLSVFSAAGFLCAALLLHRTSLKLSRSRQRALEAAKQRGKREFSHEPQDAVNNDALKDYLKNIDQF